MPIPESPAPGADNVADDYTETWVSSLANLADAVAARAERSEQVPQPSPQRESAQS